MSRVAWVAGATVVALLLALAGARQAGATAQQPDVVAIDGQKHALTVNPLEEFFTQHPERRPVRKIMSSANWRGYVAYFALADNKLVLADIKVGEASVLRDVFPGSDPVPATWFSGYLVIPDGEVVHSVHMGYGSEFSRYIIVRVQSGAVVRREQMDHEAYSRFRRSQYEAFKRTDAYRAAVADANKESEPMPPEMLDQFLFEYFSGQYMSRIFE